MAKTNKIIYWVSTAWLALGMFSTGLVQILKTKTETDLVTGLGYPSYFLPLLGAWKMLGVVAILMPKFPLLKEWAYAGFFFSMSGAIVSHLIMADGVSKIFPPLLLLVLTIISWYFRPVEKKTAFKLSL